jgi:hypothetical protein
MKHLKMLGLAAIAALGLMAFVGAGTASATTLATDAAGTVKYGTGTEIHSTLKTGTTWILENTSGETIATCTESTIKGSIGTATGTWVSISISSLIFSKCSQATVTINLGSAEIMQTSGDAGTTVGKNAKVTLNIFGVSCTYGTGEGTTLGTLTGGEAPELAINAVLPRVEGGFLCPSTARWTANYVYTSPHAIHIVE